MIPRYRTDQFSRSFLSVAVCIWNLLPSDVFSGDTLSSSKNESYAYRGFSLIFSHSLFRSLFAVL